MPEGKSPALISSNKLVFYDSAEKTLEIMQIDFKKTQNLSE